jgi:NAD(P)-dependent dehydrogenase (short-subunit alcohol dehydrogenase family)
MSAAVYPDLAGRHALVTGGSSGIGAAISAALLQQGARVAILDLLQPPPELANANYLRCDLRDPDAISSVVSLAMAEWGSFDILVNNAARDDRHTLAEVDSAMWDELMAVNLRSAFMTSRAVSAGMRRQGHGRIINLSSNSFLLGLAGYPVYATAKAGLWGMTKALARELGTAGIRVNCLIPGWVMTERQRERWVTPEALAECLAAQSIKEEIQPTDIADACLFLAADASRMMTGQMMIVDGGRV